jgi:DNA-binding XRE family transcriptional regulator
MNILAVADRADQKRLLREDDTVDKFLANNDRFEFEKAPPLKKLDAIALEIERVFNVSRNDLKGRRLNEHFQYLRYIYHVVAAKLSKASQEEISKAIGKTERSSVSLSVSRVTHWVKSENTNPQFLIYWKMWEQNARPYFVPDIKNERINKKPRIKANAKIAANLKSLRSGKGLTQQAVSDELEIPIKTYRAYEEGRAEPPMNMLIKLRQLYGLTTVEQLYE